MKNQKPSANLTMIVSRIEQSSGLQSLRTDPVWQDTLQLRQKVQDDFATQGYLSQPTFDAVLDWKLRKQRGRTEKKRKLIGADLIRVVTEAFQNVVVNADEKMQREIRLEILRSLPGVGLGVATAILALSNPKDYAIIDFRIWRALYGEEKRTFTLSDYDICLHDVREIAERLSCDVQEVDYLLWK